MINTNKAQLERQADVIERALTNLGAPGRVTGGTVTPRWVRFQVLPAADTRLSAIRRLEEDLARALAAPSVRVARRGAAVAVEIPRDNAQPVKLLPLLRQVRETREDLPPITAVLGLAEDGAPLLIRLPSPDVAHILVAGTTGSGKTILLRTIALSLALCNEVDDLALVLVDPRGGPAFGDLSTLPHLARPVILDASEAAEALASLTRLMERRDAPGVTLPAVVVVIDELADLLQVGGSDTARAITRLTQRGRGAGIHLVAATQKPTAEALGSLVKSNFPVRLCGRMTCAEDARTATGWKGTGAERLQGRGDFLAVAEGRVTRFHAAHVTPAEVEELLNTMGWDTAPVRLSSGDTPQRVEIPPAAQKPSEGEILAQRLQAMDFDPGQSYRAAARALGETEGGRRFYTVIEAVDLLRATASEEKQDGPQDENEAPAGGSGSGKGEG